MTRDYFYGQSGELFSTTANIYAHLDYASKLSSAQAMLEGLGYGNASA